jgi:DNA polymerase-3 subunit epsilon
LTTEETVEYVDLLNRVLEDRRVSADEADLLLQVATQWGLTSERVKTVHEEYLYALVTAALRDGVVTEAERRDLNGVAQLFEHGADDVEALITSAGRAVSTNKASHPFGVKSLSSLSVCFTGESQCLCEGLPLSREQAERLAAEAGLIIRKSVTRGLDILVAADPDSLSGKARRAREYGIRIMAEAVFWQSIGVDMG